MDGSVKSALDSPFMGGSWGKRLGRGGDLK